MGHEHQLDRGVEAEGAPPPDAGHVHQGRDPGQERVEEPLRLSRLQDPAEGPHLRVDVQPQDKGETGKVDPGGSRVVTADLAASADWGSLRDILYAQYSIRNTNRHLHFK